VRSPWRHLLDRLRRMTLAVLRGVVGTWSGAVAPLAVVSPLTLTLVRRPLLLGERTRQVGLVASDFSKATAQLVVLGDESIEFRLDLVEERVHLFLVVSGAEARGIELLVTHVRGCQRHVLSCGWSEMCVQVTVLDPGASVTRDPSESG